MSYEAIKHLRTAHNYLLHIADKIPDHREVARDQFLHTVRVATQYIEKARKLDPNAVYSDVHPTTKEPFSQSIDDLACRALYWEGRATVDWSRFPDEVQNGIQALLKAKAYNPYQPGVCAALGRAYLRLNQRDTANTFLKEALILEPDDFDTQKLLDGVAHADPLDQRPSAAERAFDNFMEHPVGWLFLLSVGCLALGLLFTLAGSVIGIFFSIGWFLFTAAAIIMWWVIS